MTVVASLHCYPIKSCAGIALEQAHLDRRGVRYDRHWMVVDPQGRFLSQRELPRMALISPALGDGTLTLTAPGATPLPVALEASGPRITVQVWDDQCEAIEQGTAAARWLSALLGAPLRLVRMADDWVRRVDPTYAMGPGDETSFSDGYPLLIGNEESLADLNSRLEDPLPMRRFRPNIVVRGAEAYAEDRWRRIVVGDVELAVVKPCARCAITTVDPDTGEKGKEPLKTLATYRRDDRGEVLFCQNAIHRGPGTIRVGDPIEVRETA